MDKSGNEWKIFVQIKQSLVREGDKVMQDIPVFTSAYGAASLILREIPYKKIAYIRIQDSLDPEKLLEECVSFCRMCGAEHIYATGHESLRAYPVQCSILQMQGNADPEERLVCALFPVTERTAAKFREAYNLRMNPVDHAATMTWADEKKLARRQAYFIHQGGEPLGLGILEDGTLHALASLTPGSGLRTLHTLFSLCPGEHIRLEVASTNTRAIRLYEKAGFLKTREVSRWYTVEKQPLSRKNT